MTVNQAAGLATLAGLAAVVVIAGALHQIHQLFVSINRTNDFLNEHMPTTPKAGEPGQVHSPDWCEPQDETLLYLDEGNPTCEENPAKRTHFSDWQEGRI